MKEPTISDVETALEVLEYYEQTAEEKGEGLLRALMSDSQSNIRGFSPIVIEDREKYHEIMELRKE